MPVGKAKLTGLRIDRNNLVIEVQFSQRNEFVQIGDESSLARISEVRDVVDPGRRRRDGASQYFLQTGAVNARTKPVGRQVLRRRCVIFSRVLHREQLSERASEAGQQPVRIML